MPVEVNKHLSKRVEFRKLQI